MATPEKTRQVAIMKSLDSWSPCLPMTSPSVFGRHVRVDPLNIDTDILPLWTDRPKWNVAPSFECPDVLKDLLLGIEEESGWCVHVFRLRSSGEVCGTASYVSTAPNTEQQKWDMFSTVQAWLEVMLRRKHTACWQDMPSKRWASLDMSGDVIQTSERL